MFINCMERFPAHEGCDKHACVKQNKTQTEKRHVSHLKYVSTIEILTLCRRSQFFLLFYRFVTSNAHVLSGKGAPQNHLQIYNGRIKSL
jgi:hypothetical protein